MPQLPFAWGAGSKSGQSELALSGGGRWGCPVPIILKEQRRDGESGGQWPSSQADFIWALPYTFILFQQTWSEFFILFLLLHVVNYFKPDGLKRLNYKDSMSLSSVMPSLHVIKISEAKKIWKDNTYHKYYVKSSLDFFCVWTQCIHESLRFHIHKFFLLPSRQIPCPHSLPCLKLLCRPNTPAFPLPMSAHV